MEAYTGFAQVYDLFMDNVPYEEWGAYLKGLLEEYGVPQKGVLCDLGCGTGQMTRLLAKAGYDMVGVDLSPDMLAVATEGGADGILYLCQDICELELYGMADAMYSVCDSMNYLLGEEELLQAFCRVERYLVPGGVFVFDLNTIHKYEALLGDTVICENREEGSFIWENSYDPNDCVNEYQMTFFIKEREGLYRKFEETHYQKGYSLGQVRAMAKKAGLEFAASYDAFTREPPKEDSERIYVILRKKG